jgi:hypothetical protein
MLFRGLASQPQKPRLTLLCYILTPFSRLIWSYPKEVA